MAPRFRHIHMRVGYDHGPQVPDPRAPKWLPYTEGHERWWDAIHKAAEARGDTEVTVTTEFGPPNYQVRDGFYVVCILLLVDYFSRIFPSLTAGF